MIISKINIRQINENDLTKWLVENGENKYRSKQIQKWLWEKGILDFKSMSDLSLSLRDKLENSFYVDAITLVKFVQSIRDKTVKALFRTIDNYYIEGVVIPDNNRITACISTQIGCPVKCAFCATGQLKFERNLNIGEIYQQVVELNNLSLNIFKNKLTNIVIMGMGEPLLNLENTLQAIRNIKKFEKINVSYKKITISTIGIPDKIKELCYINPDIKLAWSLHSPFDEVRQSLIPYAKKYTIKEIISALKECSFKMPITIEYVMIENINDRLEDVKELIKIASQIRCKINLIPYNEIECNIYKSASFSKIEYFQQKLVEKNIIVRIRKSKGIDIKGACGQLANKFY